MPRDWTPERTELLLPDGTRVDLAHHPKSDLLVLFQIIKPYTQVGEDRVSYTDAVPAAHVLVEGTIKWNGCADICFNPDETLSCGHGYIHWCGDEGFDELVQMLRKTKDIAYEMLPPG